LASMLALVPLPSKEANIHAALCILIDSATLVPASRLVQTVGPPT
jgi:hypothetical protein